MRFHPLCTPKLCFSSDFRLSSLASPIPGHVGIRAVRGSEEQPGPLSPHGCSEPRRRQRRPLYLADHGLGAAEGHREGQLGGGNSFERPLVPAKGQAESDRGLTPSQRSRFERLLMRVLVRGWSEWTCDRANGRGAGRQEGACHPLPAPAGPASWTARASLRAAVAGVWRGAPLHLGRARTLDTPTDDVLTEGWGRRPPSPDVTGISLGNSGQRAERRGRAWL